jgi:sulfur-carrier protein
LSILYTDLSIVDSASDAGAQKKTALLGHCLAGFREFLVHRYWGVCYFLIFWRRLLMGITVRIPSPLRQYTDQKSEIALEGKTVREILESFRAAYPDAGERFFSPKASRYINLYLNDQDIRTLNNLDTPVGEKDVLSIIFAIAGG